MCTSRLSRSGGVTSLNLPRKRLSTPCRWKLEREGGPRPVLARPQRAVHPGRELVCDREAEPRALAGPAGDEAVEDRRVRGEAGPLVGDRQRDAGRVATAA